MFVAYHDTIKKWGRVGGQNFVMHKSRKLLVGLASLTLIDIAIEEASGAPVNAPLSAPAAVYNWSGFYAAVTPDIGGPDRAFPDLNSPTFLHPLRATRAIA